MPCYKDKKRNTYYFVVSINGRHFCRRGFETLKQAKEQERIFSINRGDGTSKSELKFGELSNLFLDYKKTRVAPSTLYNYKHTLKSAILPYFENISVDKITSKDIIQYQNKINRKDYEYISKNNILVVFKMVFEFGRKFYNVKNDPFYNVEKIKKPKVRKEYNIYTIDEFKKFLSVIDEEMFKVMFSILFYLGLREGELLALQFRDIDLENKTIDINKTYIVSKTGGERIQPTKTRSSNTKLPIPNHLLPLIDIYIKETRTKYINARKNDFIFGISQPISPNTLERRNLKYSKLAGLKKIRIHDFRHSAASYYLSSGVPISVVQKIMRHSSISTTTRYLHSTDKQVEEALNLS